MKTLPITRRTKRSIDGIKKETVTISMSPETINKLDEFCYMMRLNRSVVVSRAVEKYLSEIVTSEGE